MANEPSASEILNFRVDPEQGGEVPVPLLKESNAIQQLNINARYGAENKWNRYNLFLKNLKDSFKDLNDISGMEVFEPDRKYLQEQTGKLYGDLVGNPKAIYSPEIQGKIAKLRSEATASKLNRTYHYAFNEFLARNPELDTPENKGMLNKYYKDKLGEREPFSFDVPAVFDVDKLYDEIIKDKDVAVPFAESGLMNNGELIFEKTGTDFNRENFLKKWNGALSYEQEKHGRPIYKFAKEQFDKLSAPEKVAFGGTVEEFWKKAGEIRFGAPNNVRHLEKDDVRANTNYLDKERLALDRAKLGLDWAKFDYAKDEDKYAASSVLNEARDIINKGGATQLTSPGGGKENILKIGEPELLKTFGTIDKDGRVTNVPDAVYYDTDKDQVRLVYYQKNPVSHTKEVDKDGNDVTKTIGGDVKKSESGDNLVEKQINMDQRTWLKEITKRSFPNKDIGTINHLVDDALNQTGNSLFKISQNQKAADQQQEADASYRNNKDNVQSVNGDKVTYKDGSVWQIVGNKMKRIN